MENFGNIIRNYEFYGMANSVLAIIIFFFLLFLAISLVYFISGNINKELNRNKNIASLSLIIFLFIGAICFMFLNSSFVSKRVSLEYELESKGVISCIYVKGEKDCQYKYVNGTYNQK